MVLVYLWIIMYIRPIISWVPTEQSMCQVVQFKKAILLRTEGFGGRSHYVLFPPVWTAVRTSRDQSRIKN